MSNTAKMLNDITQIESKLKKFDVSGKILSVNPKVVIEFSYTLDFNEHFQCYWEKINLDSYDNKTKNEVLKTLKNKILEEINNLESYYRIQLEDKLGKLNEDVETLIGELDKVKEEGLCSVCGLEVEYPDHYVKKCNCGRLLHTDHTTKCPHSDYEVWISAIKE